MVEGREQKNGDKGIVRQMKNEWENDKAREIWTVNNAERKATRNKQKMKSRLLYKDKECVERNVQKQMD